MSSNKSMNISVDTSAPQGFEESGRYNFLLEPQAKSHSLSPRLGHRGGHFRRSLSGDRSERGYGPKVPEVHWKPEMHSNFPLKGDVPELQPEPELEESLAVSEQPGQPEDQLNFGSIEENYADSQRIESEQPLSPVNKGTRFQKPQRSQPSVGDSFKLKFNLKDFLKYKKENRGRKVVFFKQKVDEEPKTKNRFALLTWNVEGVIEATTFGSKGLREKSARQLDFEAGILRAAFFNGVHDAKQMELAQKADGKSKHQMFQIPSMFALALQEMLPAKPGVVFKMDRTIKKTLKGYQELLETLFDNTRGQLADRLLKMAKELGLEKGQLATVQQQLTTLENGPLFPKTLFERKNFTHGTFFFLRNNFECRGAKATSHFTSGPAPLEWIKRRFASDWKGGLRTRLECKKEGSDEFYTRVQVINAHLPSDLDKSKKRVTVGKHEKQRALTMKKILQDEENQCPNTASCFLLGDFNFRQHWDRNNFPQKLYDHVVGPNGSNVVNGKIAGLVQKEEAEKCLGSNGCDFFWGGNYAQPAPIAFGPTYKATYQEKTINKQKDLWENFAKTHKQLSKLLPGALKDPNSNFANSWARFKILKAKTRRGKVTGIKKIKDFPGWTDKIFVHSGNDIANFRNFGKAYWDAQRRETESDNPSRNLAGVGGTKNLYYFSVQPDHGNNKIAQELASDHFPVGLSGELPN